MRTMFKTAITATVAIVVLGMGFASKATAQCGYSGGFEAGVIEPQSWQGAAQLRRASFLLAASRQGSDGRIVGFWKAKFVAEGTPGIPDGTVIDSPLVQWHADGTEIMNSSRPPATGNICLGVWQKSGPSSFKLNHFALNFDSSGNFIGPGQIREDITLDQKADQYEGSFTLDLFDPVGNLLSHIAGRVTATRITVDTPVGDVL